jgi:hypothetical protein
VNKKCLFVKELVLSRGLFSIILTLLQAPLELGSLMPLIRKLVGVLEPLMQIMLTTWELPPDGAMGAVSGGTGSVGVECALRRF